ncbi:MAG: 2-hydroxyacid dehydrogenase [Rhodospirillaceae bacterium]
MTRKSIFVSLALPEYVKADLMTAFDATFNETGSLLSQDALIREAAGKDALIVYVADKIDRRCIEKLPDSIKAIATYSVGYDHVDLDAAKERGIAVLHTPDVLTNTVAEATILLMLSAARRVTEGAGLIRSGKWRGWTASELNGIELTGKTLGIFGMGRIGRAIAQRGRGLEMKISYSDSYRLPPDAEQEAVYFENPEDLLKETDVLVLACASTPQTRGFLNAERIEFLRPDAIVINIARGDIIVDEALISALKRDRIFGAGLDVFNGEPAIDARYRDLPNAFILPHLGSSTMEARRGMGRILIDGLKAAAAGGTTRNRLV